jgi:uncharacterized protein (TIGR03086 family)
MVDAFEGLLIERFVLSSTELERRLREVRAEQWAWSTPLRRVERPPTRQSHDRGNVNYVRLLHGGTSAEFLRLRDADALVPDPVDAYTRPVHECADAFTRPGALKQVLDYPLGAVTGQQALAVRITDSTVHTWDLARAVGVDDNLDSGPVAWIDSHLDEIYAGLAETPVAVETTHQFFAAPEGALAHDASQQDRLLHQIGRKPERTR